MKTYTYTLKRAQLYERELRRYLLNAQAIYQALPDQRTRDLFEPFVMIPLHERFGAHIDDEDDAPQDWLRETLLACRAAARGEADASAVARSVGVTLADHLPATESAAELAWIKLRRP